MVSISKDLTSDTRVPLRSLTQYLPFLKLEGTRRQFPFVSSAMVAKLQDAVDEARGPESSRTILLLGVQPAGVMVYGIHTELPTQTLGVSTPKLIWQPD